MYFMTKNDDNITHGVSEYLCESVEDLKSLPPRCSPGSTAIILSEGKIEVYMKNVDGEWVKL